MKTIKLLFLGVASIAYAANTYAASGTATASATIVTPISISTDANLSFGNVVVGTGGGTVVLAAADAGRTATGDVSLVTSTGVSAAAFTVSGTSGMTFSISLGSATLTGTGVPMTLAPSTPSATGTISSGTATFKVGGTLTVAGSQAAGAYSGSFTVTVGYN